MILDLLIIVLILCVFSRIYLWRNKSDSKLGNKLADNLPNTSPELSENFTNLHGEVLLVTDERALMYRGRTYHFTPLHDGSYIVRLNNTTNICEGVALVKYMDRLFALHYVANAQVYLWFDISDVLTHGLRIEPVNQAISKRLDILMNNVIKNGNVNNKLLNVLSNMSIMSLKTHPDRVTVGNNTFEIRANKLCTPDKKINSVYCNNNKLELRAIYYDYNTNNLTCLDNSNRAYIIDSTYKKAKPININTSNLVKIVDEANLKMLALDSSNLKVDNEFVSIDYNNDTHLSVNNELYKIERNKVIKYSNNSGMVYEYEHMIHSILYYKETDKLLVKDVENNWYYLGLKQKLQGNFCVNLNTYLLKLLSDRNKQAYTAN
jgi:hypothetical protein